MTTMLMMAIAVAAIAAGAGVLWYRLRSASSPVAPNGRPSTPAWRVVGASVQGLSHLRSGKPCQDDHRWLVSSDVAIVAVADGAGSAEMSEIGSEVAVDHAVTATNEWLAARGNLDPSALKSAVQYGIGVARAAVLAEAGGREVAPGGLATTLLLLVATPTAIAAAQVGDGAIVVENDEHRLFALTTPRGGEFVNETDFITRRTALDDAQYAYWEGRSARLALFTDGLQRQALERGASPRADFFDGAFKRFGQADEQSADRELRRYLTSPQLRRHADDDLTLVVVSADGVAA